MKDVKLFEQTLKNNNGKTVGKLAILIGGLNVQDPKSYMDEAVFKYVGSELHNQFVEIHLDNPWTRVLLKDINKIDFKDFQEGDKF